MPFNLTLEFPTLWNWIRQHCEYFRFYSPIWKLFVQWLALSRPNAEKKPFRALFCIDGKKWSKIAKKNEMETIFSLFEIFSRNKNDLGQNRFDNSTHTSGAHMRALIMLSSLAVHSYLFLVPIDLIPLKSLLSCHLRYNSVALSL